MKRFSFFAFAVLLAAATAGSEDAPPPVVRRPLPDAAALKKTEALVREVHKEDFAKTTAAERLAFARTLLKEGAETTDDFTARYVLFRQAVEIAAQAGNTDLAWQALTVLARDFEVDLAAERASLLTQLEKTARTPESARALAARCEALAEELLGADRYEEARRMLVRAETAAYNAKDQALVESFKFRAKEMNDLAREAMGLQEALQTLAAKPQDPAAGAAAGRFYCLVRGTWEKGLPLLAQGNVEKLKDLAAKELIENKDGDAWLALGDGWLACAETETGRAKIGALQRASRGYEQALPLLNGLTKAKAEKQLALCIQAFAASGGGAVEVGNVALAGRGAKAKAPHRPEDLIDGNITRYDGGSGFADGQWPCEFLVTLPKTYLLREIRILLWDGNNRSYRYTIETSPDGARFTLLADHSRGQRRSWQALSFAPRLVKAIKVRGLHNTANAGFHIVELEAYCLPPSAPAKPKYPSEP